MKGLEKRQEGLNLQGPCSRARQQEPCTGRISAFGFGGDLGGFRAAAAGAFPAGLYGLPQSLLPSLPQAEELKMATQLSGPVMPIRSVSETASPVLCSTSLTLGGAGMGALTAEQSVLMAFPPCKCCNVTLRLSCAVPKQHQLLNPKEQESVKLVLVSERSWLAESCATAECRAQLSVC